MADVNTDSSSKEFIFGQNMEDRVIKPQEGNEEEEQQQSRENDTEKESENSENGNPEEGGEAQNLAPSAPLLRPSVFKPAPAPGSGILAPSRLGNNPFVAKQPVAQTANEGGLNSTSFPNNPFAARLGNSAASEDGGAQDSTPAKLLLRPSALDKQTAGFGTNKEGGSSYKSSFKLEPAKMQSPFSQAKETREVSKQGSSSKSSSPSKPVTPGEPEASSLPTQAAAPGAQSEEVRQRLFGGDTSSENSSTSRDNFFQSAAVDSRPEGQAEETGANFLFGQKMGDRVTNAASSSPSSAAEPSTSSSGASGFVFGQKLSQRAVTTPHKDKEKAPPEEEKKEKPEEKEASNNAANDTSATTLEESAAQYEARNARPELAKVDVKTGEEEESNVFQLHAKLYVFDKVTQSWIEKGRGLLRLNDMSSEDSASFQSRLVMRTQGSLRVVLNTKVWPAMTIERASPKSIRISAVDPEEGVKIFLIMASPKDSDQIFSAIDSRVQQLRMQEQEGEGEVQEEEEEEDQGKAEALAASPASSVPASQDPPVPTQCDKRQSDTNDEPAPVKKRRMDPEQRREAITEESNDSSTVDPETEASNESFASSPTIKSSSSDA